MLLKYLGSGPKQIFATSEPILFNPTAEVPDTTARVLLKERSRDGKPLFEVVKIEKHPAPKKGKED